MDQFQFARDLDLLECDKKNGNLTKDTEVKERMIKSLLSQLEDQKDENQKIKLNSSQSIQVTYQNSKIGHA